MDNRKRQKQQQLKMESQLLQQFKEHYSKQEEEQQSTQSSQTSGDQFLLMPGDKLTVNVERAGAPSRRSATKPDSQAKHRGLNNL